MDTNSATMTKSFDELSHVTLARQVAPFECPWCDSVAQPRCNDGVLLSCRECGCIVGEK